MLDPCVNDHATPAGPEATVAAAYVADYRIFELGKVPGVPGPLGGTVISKDDPDVLLIAGASEQEDGAIYAIRLKRGICKHIIGFDGTASKIATTPNVDANLVYTNTGLLLYTRWPVYGFGGTVPARRDPAHARDGSPRVQRGGRRRRRARLRTARARGGRRPPLRHVAGWLLLSPRRARQWQRARDHQRDEDRDPQRRPWRLCVRPRGVYRVSEPIACRRRVGRRSRRDLRGRRTRLFGVPCTRKELLSKFPKPWGAYFEPVTGDFLFLTWGAATGGALGDDDCVYIVQAGLPAPAASASSADAALSQLRGRSRPQSTMKRRAPPQPSSASASPSMPSKASRMAHARSEAELRLAALARPACSAATARSAAEPARPSSPRPCAA